MVKSLLLLRIFTFALNACVINVLHTRSHILELIFQRMEAEFYVLAMYRHSILFRLCNNNNTRSS